MMKRFYRVCHKETLQGLWYDQSGLFTGFIHGKFNFCTNSSLKMDFDSELCGYLSATDSLRSLFNWFTESDIKELQKHDYLIHVYETDDFKFYEKFQHLVINKENSRLIKTISL